MNKKYLNLFLLFFLILILLKIGVSTNTFFAKPEISYQPEENITPKILELTNDHRVKLGLSPLEVNPRLTQAAFNKAKDIITNQYFNHTSPDGKKFSDWIKEVNYKYFYVGENLAIDFDSPEEIFEAWLKSPKHKENIERPEFQEIGLATIKGKFKSRETIVVVQLFGSRVLGINENNLNNDIPLTNNYFYEPSSNYLEIEKTVNYLLLFSGFLIIFLLYNTKNNFQVATVDCNFNETEARKLKLWPNQNDNKQKPLKSENLNISVKSPKQNNQQLKKKQCRVKISANQLHRK